MMELDFFWLAIGLAVLGYFISDGLKNFKNPQASSDEYPTLIKEKDLHFHIGLSKTEVQDLLNRYPDAPKIVLEGTNYYPYQQFLKWLASDHIYQD